MIQEVRGLMECGVSEEFLLKLGLEYQLHHPVSDRRDRHA